MGAPTPIQNATTPIQSATPSPTVEPAFVPDPSGRGTIGLLASCVLTLSLCVWTALHLNCHPSGTSSFKKVATKALWAGTALIAPEYVLWRAILQWETARQIRDRVNKYLFPDEEQTRTSREDASQRPTAPSLRPSTSNETQEPPVDGIQMVPVERNAPQPTTPWTSTSDEPRDEPSAHLLQPAPENEIDIHKNPKNRWTMGHGFFGVMGGFQMVVPPEYTWVLEDPSTTLLTPSGIVLFAKHGLLPDVPVKRLKERGKADLLAKTLVCAQAIWMVIETIARRASGLPITLLELNTLAHVGCAVFMYAVWWKKPQDVSVSVEVPVKPSIGAIVSSPCFRRKDQPPCNKHLHRPANNVVQAVVPKGKVDVNVEDMQSKFGISTLCWPSAIHLETEIKSDGVIMLLDGQGLEGSLFYFCYTGGAGPSLCKHLTGYRVSLCKHLTQEQVTMLTSKTIFREEDDIIRDIGSLRSKITFLSRASNHQIKGNFQSVSELKFLVILTVLGLLYAGIHASSWNGHFPSYVEAILWHVAVCYTAASGFMAMLVYLALTRLRSVLWLVLAYISFFLTGILVFCRCYLVVEAFISLRSLPIGSYSTVAWANFLPHFG